MKIEPINSWIDTQGKPLVIAGPCSAESEEQVMATAMALQQDSRVKIFRAGVWKPRTRPGGFEGVGEDALQWLRRVKEETSLLTATEVAEVEHVHLALKYKVDILWIGARTVVNPFALNKLVQALEGRDIPILIKNPIHPDINLWLGAIERFQKAGHTKLVAIHRGFYFFHKSPYRNAPMWEIPIELKSSMPELPIICDPSHITGNREMIADVSQKALDLEMEGLMIESHINPEVALSDKAQQLTPMRLFEVLDQLVVRQKNRSVSNGHLEQLRSEIDKIDAELLHVLSRRMEIIHSIGDYKKEKEITILQLKRWRNLIHDRIQMGKEQGLDPVFLKEILTIVHKESIRLQSEIFKEK